MIGGDVAIELARAACRSGLRAASWCARATLRAGTELTGAAFDPDRAADLVQDATAGVRRRAREFVGFDDLDERLKTQMPSDGAQRRERRSEPVVTERELRIRGAELLRESASVDAEDGVHPAYARILEELAPDEARILRLLAVDGPQPAVDVCSANLIGVPSGLIARNLTMIGPAAGCRHRDGVPTYLDNLERLGLIRVSDTPLEDLASYQVLEAQPEVMAAIRNGTRAKPIQHSVRLTSLGSEFCHVCLPLDAGEVEIRSQGAGGRSTDRR